MKDCLFPEFSPCGTANDIFMYSFEMEGRRGTHPTLAPVCVCARVCPCETVFVPKWNNAFPLKGMCHPVLV